jgi:cytochrome b
MSPSRLRVWDLPLRLFHWLLVLLIAALWLSAEYRLMQWHRWFGYAATALLLFRILWGFAGSTTARFAAFVRGPRAVAAYLRGAAAAPGHNPLGGWSVLAMLIALLAQAGLGLFAVDVDGIESGPLARWVSFDAGRLAAEAHELLFNGLLALLALHLGAVAFYRFIRHDDLVGAMIRGHRAWSGPVPKLHFAPLSRALVVAACSAAAVAALVWLAGT